MSASLGRAKVLYDQARFREAAGVLGDAGFAQIAAGLSAKTVGADPDQAERRRDLCLEALQLQAEIAVLRGNDPGVRSTAAWLLELQPDHDFDPDDDHITPDMLGRLTQAADEAADSLGLPCGDLAGKVTVGARAAPAGLAVRAQGRLATTDATGAYALPRLRAGSIRVRVSGAGVSDTIATFVVRPGANVGDIRLERARLVSLTGRLVSQVDGRGVPGVVVCMDDEQCFTDGKGRFTLRDVPTGLRRLVVPAAKVGDLCLAEARHTVDVSPGMKPLEVALEPAGPGLLIRTDPAGACVWLDGNIQAQVRTPGLVPAKPGWHFVEAKVPGSKRWGKAGQWVVVEQSEATIVPLQLPQLPVAPGAGLP